MEPGSDTREVVIYRCLRCGKEYDSPTPHFYMAKYSELYIKNDRRAPLCRTCVSELFNTYSKRYQSDRTACIMLCYMLDIPFFHSLYDSVVTNNNIFSIGLYLRQVSNNRQYQNQTFSQTILSRELEKNEKDIQEAKEDKWSAQEKRNAVEVTSVLGYDPFEGYPPDDRKFLFSEFIKYLDEDTAEDPFKLSQIIQIVNNNNQIRQYDLRISALDPVKDSTNIKELNAMKSSLVTSNDKIAKENEISVKNRSNKDVGRSTLTYLMRDLREKDFQRAEANYYDQLRSEGTQWAMDMSFKALRANTFFDENDKEEIFDIQRSKIQALQAQVDDLIEEKRQLVVEIDALKQASDADVS
jgi:DNA-directed RNA polymerase subunit RPC12/RpoP